MKIRLFDPTVVAPEEYRHKYPEIDRIPEFNDLSARALVFIWWYANPTSPLVLSIIDDYERVEAAMKISKFNPGKGEKEKILSLQFENNMAIAIDKMSQFDPGIRYKGYKMIKTLFEQYEGIIAKGTDAFKVVEGKGDNQVSYIDYKKFVDTSSKVVEVMPDLIQKLEEGFGVIEAKDEDEDDGSGGVLRDWHRSRSDE